VIGLKSVDRHYEMEIFNSVPLGRNDSHCASNKLDTDPMFAQYRQKSIQLAKPHERLASDDRDMQRMVFINQC
jgi:hypothetical protein